MAHANARLTEFGRLLLVQRITELGWPPAQAAEALGCRGPPPTSGWPATANLVRPGWPTDPRGRIAALTPSPPPRSVGCWPLGGVAARSHRLGYHLRMPRSTVYGVLARHGMSRLAHTDRASTP
jgi:hypothetical protein